MGSPYFIVQLTQLGGNAFRGLCVCPIPGIKGRHGLARTRQRIFFSFMADIGSSLSTYRFLGRLLFFLIWRGLQSGLTLVFFFFGLLKRPRLTAMNCWLFNSRISFFTWRKSWWFIPVAFFSSARSRLARTDDAATSFIPKLKKSTTICWSQISWGGLGL